MTYRLIDLYTGKEVKFDEKRSLLFYWGQYIGRSVSKRFALDFEMLNVTGKDISTEPFFIEAHAPLMRPTWQMHRVTRRYQVFDDEGRSVDIRKWSTEIADVESGKYVPWTRSSSSKETFTFRRGPVPYIRKQHAHRLGTESFFHASLIALEEKPLEDTDISPVIDHSSVRKRGRKLKFESWDNAEMKANNKWNRRCWKDSSKAPRQWAKHKNRPFRITCRSSSMYEEDPENDWDNFCLQSVGL